MPYMYLRLIDDHIKYTNAADYDNEPFEAPDGFEWVAGALPEGATPYVELSLQDKLNAVFGTLDLSLKIQFSTLKAAVKLELDQGHIDVAEGIIQTTTIPSELEPQRAALLALFPQ